MEVFSSSPFCTPSLFPHLGEWHNHLFESSLILSLLCLKNTIFLQVLLVLSSNIQGLCQLMFTFPFATLVQDTGWFLEKWNQYGLPKFITLKKKKPVWTPFANPWEEISKMNFSIVQTREIKCGILWTTHVPLSSEPRTTNLVTTSKRWACLIVSHLGCYMNPLFSLLLLLPTSSESSYSIHSTLFET